MTAASQDEDRLRRGKAMLAKVYPGEFDLPEPHEDYTAQMLRNLFCDIWDRDVMSLRDRRLVIIGALAALGEPSLVGRQTKMALANGELNAAEVRELLVLLPAYVGYPRVGHIIPVVEQVLREAGAK